MKQLTKIIVVATLTAVLIGIGVALTTEPTIEEGRAALLEEAKKAHEDEYFRSKP